LLVLLSGAAMVGIAKLGFQTFWVAWGFAGILAHFVYGATVMRKRAAEFVPMVTGAVDEARVALAGRRLIAGNAIYLLLMASVIVVMVLKPTL
jgi:hypothetical protein